MEWQKRFYRDTSAKSRRPGGWQFHLRRWARRVGQWESNPAGGRPRRMALLLSSARRRITAPLLPNSDHFEVLRFHFGGAVFEAIVAREHLFQIGVEGWPWQLREEKARKVGP